MANLDNIDRQSGSVPSSSIDFLLKRFELPECPAASADTRLRRIGLLTRTIQTQILPKLALDHRNDPATTRTPHAGPLINDTDLSSFVNVVLANDVQTGTARMEELVSIAN